MKQIDASIISGMIGKKCWHVSAGGVTAPSFVLVFGGKIPRSVPLKNPAQPPDYQKYRGSIELLVWCSWRLQKGDKALASSAQEATEMTELKTLSGLRITNAKCTSAMWDLEIDFEDGRSLSVFSDNVESASEMNQNWEMWLPETVVSAGPGSRLETDAVQAY